MTTLVLHKLQIFATYNCNQLGSVNFSPSEHVRSTQTRKHTQHMLALRSSCFFRFASFNGFLFTCGLHPRHAHIPPPTPPCLDESTQLTSLQLERCQVLFEVTWPQNDPSCDWRLSAISGQVVWIGIW